MTLDHPESPKRLWAIQDALIQARLQGLLCEYEAIEASEKDICRVHSKQHFDYIKNLSPKAGLATIDADTYMNCHSFQAAKYAAGAVIMATDLVMDNKVANAFCAVRPPGHHAESSRAMGFCLFNNIAIGVAYALENFSVARIAVLDFDVHHGNGTEDIFLSDKRVLFCSTYQHPFYPYSEVRSVSGHIVNTPLPAGTGGKEFRAAITRDWLPALHAFKPELIYISAGFDAHKLDSMAHFSLLEDDYSWVTREIFEIAKSYSHGRIISSLEGGYHLSALANSVVAHLKVLMQVDSRTSLSG